ncbi:MAG: hypothetical protein KDB07_02850, partial [Planctomycetes bacterium]|nr:hypothetical protein [Planctomycetota bacterium]
IELNRLESDGVEDDQLYRNRADVKQALGDAKGCLDDALKQIEKYPEVPQGYNSLANAYVLNDRKDDYRRVAHEAVEKFPDSAWARSLYARYLYHEGELEKSEAEFKKTLELDVDKIFLETYGFLAIISSARGNYQQAEEYARQAMALGGPQHLARLARAQMFIWKGERDQARRELDFATATLDSVLPEDRALLTRLVEFLKKALSRSD